MTISSQGGRLAHDGEMQYRVNSSWFQQGMMIEADPQTGWSLMVEPHNEEWRVKRDERRHESRAGICRTA